MLHQGVPTSTFRGADECRHHRRPPGFRVGEIRRRNAAVVRLKEVRTWLRIPACGIRAYSFIDQVKIGMILSGRPQERGAY